MNIQHLLFEEIRKRHESGFLLSSTVADLLGVSDTAARRLINGTTSLKADGLAKLAGHYQISVDSLLHRDGNTAVFSYRNLIVSDLPQYKAYMTGLLSALQEVEAGERRRVIFVADDVPIFHVMAYPLLTYFKLYAWNRDMENDDLGFERFVDTLDRSSMERIFRETAETYRQIPSIEIWTSRTIVPILSQLGYFHKLNCFDDRSTLGMLCGQLKALVNTVEGYAVHGRKSINANFDMVKSPVDPGRGLLYTSCDGKHRVTLKLHSINGMSTTHEKYCEETRSVLESTIRKCLPLSGMSEIKRKAFFDMLRNKIENKLSGAGHIPLEQRA